MTVIEIDGKRFDTATHAPVPRRAWLDSLSDFDCWMTETFGAEQDFLPVDWTSILDGDLNPDKPSILRRSDGVHLIYEGKVHWLAGEPEAGKSWLALLAVKEMLEQGRRVVYFDYEMSPKDLARRLLGLGLSRKAFTHLDYVRPPARMSDEWLKFYGTGDGNNAPLFKDAALVVFDACTEAMVRDGLSPMDNEDVALWVERAPRLAKNLGAAVLILDHVPKDRENRGRYAIGAQHKLAHTDVMYALYNVQPFAPGKVGIASLSVKKDRDGGVRQHMADDRRIATFVLNSEDDPSRPEAFLCEPSDATDKGPTVRMDTILQVARDSVAPLSKNQLESVGGGRTTTSREAVARLIADGQLIEFPDDVARERVHPRYVAAPDKKVG